MAQDYKSTLHLPQTDFPMRAGLAQKEPQILEFWKRKGVYDKLQKKNFNGPKFSFHDGPPYANGEMHLGHALNKSLKDFVVKYRSMNGYACPYVPGWDTHGLPIELKVLKDGGLDKDSISPVELRQKCAETARYWIGRQKEGMIRLGCFADWEHPYMTLQPEYEAAELDALAGMVEKGYVYRGQKPVYWCIDCQTALAAAEIEYGDETSPSIFVAYSMEDLSSKFPELAGEPVSVVVWTTTPWTLPASMAVAVGLQYDYGFYRVEKRLYLLACGMVDSVAQATGLTFGEPVLTVKGQALEGCVAFHPFLDRKTPIVLADYVTLDAGTGCVHTAPGHGVEDYETGCRYGIEIYNPVDGRGRFTPDTPLVGGMDIEKGAQTVMQTLRDSGRLLGVKKIVHSYPHCWRCHKPVVFRSTDQWFINVEAFREEALKAIDEDVKWMPTWGHDRIYNMVRERSDWCISRQRIWGVPIPAFTCSQCGETILTADRIRVVSAQVARFGSDYWWSKDAEELLGHELARCPHCGGALSKGTDILDVWFDSGVSHFAVLKGRPELSWPADLYLEGADQHRGWFQTSLLASVAVTGKSPYKAVLTHGFFMDGEGRKMSKSLGNVVSAQKIVEKYGADILRLWVASTDYRSDMRISYKIVDSLVESYRRIRNTARYLLGNLHGFNPSTDRVPYEKMGEFDRWVLALLNRTIRRVTESYENYEFHIPTMTIHQLCVNELSSVYLDVNKDRLYADPENDTARRATQTVMWELLTTLTRMLAPVLSFTSEEIWQAAKEIDPSLEESVFLAEWPKPNESLIDEELLARWDKILAVRGAVSKALEEARASGQIGQSLEAAVTASLPEEYRSLLSEREWNDLCITSSFKLGELPGVPADEMGVALSVSRVEGQKCPRCWKYVTHWDENGLCDRCHSIIG
ncbi:isoleucine--tRNA ligase [Jonquetella anthropi]|uniref:isoleucine--tRNA ligase n=1 Tax=Jonquetella anthropi TaxID=428712 RepID=UPI0001B910EE|nr:isoleucine--tRNA ligase [Jonquetella anthropi]EEX48440.1 isoleucine--tRNA ligase [Jonquetella anthropi E3_33 E1]